MNQYQKIVDFTKIEREGVREIMPIDPRRFQSLSFRGYKDKETRAFFGIPIGEDEKRNTIFKPILITGIKKYDLTILEDAQEWHIVKSHPSVLGSPNQSNKPLLKIFDPEKEARERIKKNQLEVNALIAASKIDGHELVNFSRLMGISPENNEPIVVKSLFLDACKANPEKFNRLLLSETRHIAEVFARALAVGLVKHSLDKGYMYNDSMPLGISDAHAIQYLSRHKDLLANIDIESKERDSSLKRPEYAKTENVVSMTENSLQKQNAELMQELENVKKLLAKQQEQPVPMQVQENKKK